jgi:hypothetical protein
MKARLDKGAQVAARIRQALPVIPMSYATPIETGPLQRTEAVCPSWSVAQHVKRNHVD